MIFSKTLPKLTSNNKPILLQLEEEENLGPIPFQFSPLWIEKEGFMESVISAWSTLVTWSPSSLWEQKQKATKIALKDWVRKSINTPIRHIKETIQLLENLQIDLESKEIIYTELEKEKASQAKSYLSF